MRPSVFSDAAGSDISGRDKCDGDIRYTGERPEGHLVVAGFAGYEGTGILVREKRERLQRILPQWLVDRAASFAEDAAAICTAAERAGSVHALISDTWAVPGKTGDSQEAAGGREMGGQEKIVFPAGDGGVLAALWFFAEKFHLGMEISLRDIPIRQETVEICEILEFNPYQLFAGGCVLIGTADPSGLIRLLEREGIAAAWIGEISPGSVRRILNGETVGYLNIPRRIEKMPEGTRAALTGRT